MSYRVIWDDQAIDALQRIYDAAADKEAVEHAVLRVGMELSANPLEAGESRDKGSRILFKHPLVILYEIHEQMPEVLIVNVGPFRRIR